jgi:hypothetical protein
VPTSARSRGHPAGVLLADRAFSSVKPDDLQLARDCSTCGRAVLGARRRLSPVYDYKVDQLGVQAQHGYIKDPAHEGLDDRGRRRVGGLLPRLDSALECASNDQWTQNVRGQKCPLAMLSQGSVNMYNWWPDPT